MTSEFEAEVFEYLDGIRESGIVNMFGAAPYIEDMFELTRSQARELLIKWMSSYGNS